MKKTRQFLAITGIILLVGMYISTIVCALSANENFMTMLMASLYASFVIPVLIWAYTFLSKLLNKNDDSDSKDIK